MGGDAADGDAVRLHLKGGEALTLFGDELDEERRGSRGDEEELGALGDEVVFTVEDVLFDDKAFAEAQACIVSR